jgi:hypothetical protein
MKTARGAILLILAIILTPTSTILAKDKKGKNDPPPVVQATPDPNAAPKSPDPATNNAAAKPNSSQQTSADPGASATPGTQTPNTQPIVQNGSRLPRIARLVVSDSRTVDFYAHPAVVSGVNLENVLARGLEMRGQQQQQVVAVPGMQQQPGVRAQAAVPAQWQPTPLTVDQYLQGQGQGQVPPPPYQGKNGSSTLTFQNGAWVEVPDAERPANPYSGQNWTGGAGGGFGYYDQQVVPATYVPDQSQYQQGWQRERPFVGGRMGGSFLGGFAKIRGEGGVYAHPSYQPQWRREMYIPAEFTTSGTWPPPRR